MMYDELIKRLREVSLEFGELDNVSGLLTEAANAVGDLLEAGRAMHEWIFLNSGDELAAYDECGLSDEMNVALGYCGGFEIVSEEGEE